MPATNAKPREKFAGPHDIFVGVTLPWRMPDCSYRLQVGAVSGFIDTLPSIHNA